MTIHVAILNEQAQECNMFNELTSVPLERKINASERKKEVKLLSGKH